MWTKLIFEQKNTMYRSIWAILAVLPVGQIRVCRIPSLSDAFLTPCPDPPEACGGNYEVTYEPGTGSAFCKCLATGQTGTLSCLNGEWQGIYDIPPCEGNHRMKPLPSSELSSPFRLPRTPRRTRIPHHRLDLDELGQRSTSRI